jgi:hypothetical protein
MKKKGDNNKEKMQMRTKKDQKLHIYISFVLH